MKPLVVGTPQDVAGFALAGVEGVVCATREEADRAIARAGRERLVIVSPEFARDCRGTPLTVALPPRS